MGKSFVLGGLKAHLKLQCVYKIKKVCALYTDSQLLKQKHEVAASKKYEALLGCSQCEQIKRYAASQWLQPWKTIGKELQLYKAKTVDIQ